MGTGNNIQIHSVGYAPNTFYVYEQVYDEYGNPVQDAFIDQNKDGIIDDKDLVLKHKSRPDVFFGFNMLFRYKNWDFGFNAHGSTGYSTITIPHAVQPTIHSATAKQYAIYLNLL